MLNLTTQFMNEIMLNRTYSFYKFSEHLRTLLRIKPEILFIYFEKSIRPDPIISYDILFYFHLKRNRTIFDATC